MHKLIERIGTDQHKYRVLFQLSRILVAQPSQAMHYRVVLQRDSKQYSSNYIRTRSGKQTNIDEVINIKVTMFYDPKKQGYQDKKFDIHILCKADSGEAAVATFAIMLEKHLTADHQLVTLRDQLGNKLELYITAEKLEGKAARDSDTNSSVERSLDVRPKTFSAKYHGSEVTEQKPIYQTRISEKPLEESKKSIIDLVKFDDDDDDDKKPVENQKPVEMQQYNSQPPPLVIQDPQAQEVKRHKPIFSKVQERSSKSPSFKDLMNIKGQKLPVGSQNGFKKRQSKPYGTVESTKTSNVSNNPVSTISVQPFQPMPSLTIPPQQGCVPTIQQHKISKPPFIGYNVPSDVASPSAPMGSLKKALSQLQEQLSGSMLRKSSILQTLKNEQQDLIQKVRSQNTELKTSHNKLAYDYQDLLKQNKQLKQRNADLNKQHQRTLGQLRDVKELRDRLISDNSELLAKAELMGQANDSISKVRSELMVEYSSLKQQLIAGQSLATHQAAALAQLEDQKQQLLAKQSQLIRKYQKTFNELSNEKTISQQLRLQLAQVQSNYQSVVAQKDHELGMLKNQVSHLQFMMLKPDEQLENKEKQMLKERLQRLIKDLRDQTEENESIQAMLKNDLKIKSKELEEMSMHLRNQQARIQQAENLWFTKQKSLSKALESKDRRIAEMTKQIQQLQAQISASAKYIQQEKLQLIGRMENLSNQLTRLKDVDQQLAKAELTNRELDFKLRQCLNQQAEAKIQITKLGQQSSKLRVDRQQQKELVNDLQSQLVKTNMKLACIVEKVFTINPKLAQELTNLKPDM